YRRALPQPVNSSLSCEHWSCERRSCVPPGRSPPAQVTAGCRSSGRTALLECADERGGQREGTRVGQHERADAFALVLADLGGDLGRGAEDGPVAAEPQRGLVGDPPLAGLDGLVPVLGMTE